MAAIASSNVVWASVPPVESSRIDPMDRKDDSAKPSTKRSILLVRTRGDEAVMLRVRAELRAHGWRIIELQGDNVPVGYGELARLAAEQVATAAVRIDAVMGQIEIHIARSWGNIDEVLQSAGEAVDEQVLAFRTTEALRAHGMVVDAPPPKWSSPDAEQQSANVPQPPNAAAKPSTMQPATGIGQAREVDAPKLGRVSSHSHRAEPPQQLWFELAPAVSASPGGMGSIVMGWAGVRYAVLPFLSAAAFGALPMHSREVIEPEGRANVSTYLIGGAFEIDWMRRTYGSAAAGLGATLVLTNMDGAPQAGYRGRSDRVTSAGPHFHMRFDLALAPRWRIFASPLVGVSIPEVQVAFDQRFVRSWGQPWALLALGIEFCATAR